ncbi:hypothetical protein HPB47_025218 [Ixodes persulcatus]|uniref:Uncharacterized protein n=1 Tax=Ixodes persulcatus TaxID=34615 RepID=A0AC60Q3Z2_IXOPE|nr:hypothetical protein HPB47_025218 [Ixodes persulcatus]
MRPLIGYHKGPNGENVATGLGGYVFYMLMASMKLNYEIYVPTDNVYAGTFPNGSWGGQLGMIARNECDIGIGPILPTLRRYEVAMPLPLYYFIRLTPCGGTRRQFKTDVFQYVAALDRQVWAALLTSLVLLTFLKLLPSMGKPRTLDRFTNSLFELFGNMFFEATPKPPKHQFGRWLVSFWWLAVLVVMTGFTSFMKASMMVKDEAGRLNTIKDIIKRPEITPMVIRGSTYERIFMTSHLPAHQRLWQQILRTGGQLPVPELLSRRVFDLMLEEKAVFFCDDIILYSNIARLYPEGYVGEFYMGTDFFINNEFTMFVRRDLDARIIRQLHKRLRWLWESGLPQEWVRKVMEKSLRASTSHMSGGYADMKLSDVGAIFYLLLIGLGAAFAAFIAEVFAGLVVLRSKRLPRRESL